MILVLALSPALDVTYEVDRLQRGGVTRPSRVTRVAGGKGLNVARVAHALGAPVHALVPLGGAQGRWIAERLSADGVAHTAVPLRLETRTCIAVVETAEESTSSTDLYEAATPLDPDEWDAVAAAARSTAASLQPDWVVVSGSLPAGVDGEDLVALLAALRARGAAVAVDSSGGGLAQLVGVADLVKINRAEAAELTGVELPDAVAAADAVTHGYGIDAVVTDGARGAAAVLRGRREILPPVRRRGRFSAGSGDAFLAGLLTGLSSGRSGADSLALAAEAGERNALVAGQGILAGPAPGDAPAV